MGDTQSEVSNCKTLVERIPVGDCGEIVLSKIKKFIGRQVVEDGWIAEYSVGRTSCEFCLIKINRNNHDEWVSILFHDRAPGLLNCYDLEMGVSVEEDFLMPINFHFGGPKFTMKLPDCKSKNPLVQGGVLRSASYLYGRDTGERQGLIIILEAKRSDRDEECPYMITVKHYLFVSDACSSDAGLCVVAKIRNDKGEGLSVQLEKPVEQHRLHLLSFFDDVKRTGWRPNYSADFASSNQNEGKVPLPHVLSVGPEPHGYNNNSISMSGQQNVSSVISTSGYTNGNYNGSLIFENCHVWFDKDGNMFRSYK